MDEAINLNIDAERPKSSKKRDFKNKRRKTLMIGDGGSGSVKEINKFVKHLKTDKDDMTSGIKRVMDGKKPSMNNTASLRSIKYVP